MSGGGMARRGLTAVIQSYAANLARAVLQFVVGVILARLLGPQEFGLVAIAWLAVGIGGLVMDIGLSSSIIQSPDVQSKDIAYIFYLQILIGLVLAMLVFAFAPFIAGALSAENATPLIQVMALTFVLKAIGQTSFALLNRQMRFGALQIITVVSYALGFGGVALVLAAKGFGAWSVVAAAIAQAGVATAAYIWLARPPLRIGSMRHPMALLRFGAKTMGANLLSWAILNVDAMLVSRFLGPAALGLYSRALALANLPTIIVASIQPLLFSAASRIQSHPEKIAQTFLAATTAVAMIMAPVLVVTSILSVEVITGLYGEAWRPAGKALTPLALAILANGFTLLCGPLLMSINQTQREIHAQIITVAVMLLTVPLAATHSLEAASWAMFGIYAVRMVLLTRSVMAALTIRVADYLRALMPSLVLMPLFPVVSALATRHFSGNWGPELGLGLIITASAIGYALALAIIGPGLVAGPLLELLLRSGRLPVPVTKWIGFRTRNRSYAL